MSEVGALIIKLQAQTAEFRDEMGKVKQDLDDLKGGATEAGESIDYSMTESRHGVMMLGEVFGIHLPRGVTTFIASLGPVGAAMEAAFPFLAIILGVTLLVEHLMKIGEAAEKAREAGEKLSTDFAESMDSTKLKIVESEIEIRKLAGEPAWDLLDEKLHLEDAKQGIENMKKLEGEVKTFLENAKPSTNWNPFNWFDESDISAKVKFFQDSMKGKDQTGQLDTAQAALATQQKLLVALQSEDGVSKARLDNETKYLAFLQQETAQLQAQADAAVLADQAKQGKDLQAKTEKQENAQRELAAATNKANEEMAVSDAQLWLKRVLMTTQNLDAITALKKVAENAEYDAKRTALEKEKELLDPTKDAAKIVQINAHLHDLENEHQAKLIEIIKHANDEREKLETEAAKKAEKIAKDAAKMDADVAKETARHDLEMAKLDLAAREEHAKFLQAIGKKTADATLADEKEQMRAALQVELDGLAAEQAALAKDHTLTLVEITKFENKKKELIKKEQNEELKLTQDAEAKKLLAIQKAEQSMAKSIEDTAIQSMFQYKNMDKAFEHLGQQMIQHALTNLLQMQAIDRKKELMDAKMAAKDAFKWVMSDVPFPVNAVLAPLAAAGAFAAVMAFEEGGKIPGSGPVPIIGHGGETVVTKALTDRVERNELNNTTSHVSNDKHYHIDARGADAGVENRVLRAIAISEERAVARSVSAVNDRAQRQR